MDTFNELYAVPGLCDSIGMEKAMQFIRIASRLKDSINTAQHPTHNASEASDEIPNKTCESSLRDRYACRFCGRNILETTSDHGFHSGQLRFYRPRPGFQVTPALSRGTLCHLIAPWHLEAGRMWVSSSITTF
ncbi:hypothetical protein C8R46DRAFT_1030613 [Mycena filopes]|nr:hypothetical protein C8R46DRAFT_1030613 [Mycena filopes]